jgi:hypothetical protein
MDIRETDWGTLQYKPTCGTPHPQCMPEEYKCAFDDAVQAYRKYYVNDKKDIAKWEKSRFAPDWYANKKYRIGYDYPNMREEWVNLEMENVNV